MNLLDALARKSAIFIITISILLCYNADFTDLNIFGRNHQPPTTNNKKQQPGRKFTSFLSSIVVELERDPNLYPDGNLIEWKFPAGSDHDGVEIKRRGDSNVKARIILQLDYSPQKFKLSPELAEMLSLQMETKPGIVMAVWQYVKVGLRTSILALWRDTRLKRQFLFVFPRGLLLCNIQHHKLQDTDDKRIVRCDLRMQQVFRVQQLYFAQVPELLAPHLILPDPIILEYIIRVDKEYHLSRHAYDIDIEVDDAIRAKMASVVASTATQKEIMTLDEKIVQCVQSVNNSKIKRDFLLQFATSPVDFINKWVASQARDLEIILGESRVNLEEMRRTDFYRQDWVKEAVFHYMTAKTQQRMQELLSARQ
ncbi:hypothetical protein BC938DRAFT_479278 [Jimgerdemannia flammicorona]|uniref:SWIB domain-containing protein n=1 Tax=Jimgerdemannia flammicorona TaxID=994334 RepID=A0A433QL95_9FUNG|nr:hypothetical protein BC938DRAFT_479278 [Jimgerdemannia flammicorona]